MNVNFGLFPPLQEKAKGRDRKRLMAHRAIEDLELWLGTPRAAAE
jgi:methylenetetrahydrofolate--tRNA-(uracil-5-)-methyltransferase